MQVVNRCLSGCPPCRAPCVILTVSKSLAEQLKRHGSPLILRGETKRRTLLKASQALQSTDEARTSVAGQILEVCGCTLRKPHIPYSECEVSLSAGHSGRPDEIPTYSGIDLIFGPMFAGKSSELIRRIAAQEAAGRRVMVLKSNKDNRYGTAQVITHDGSSKACYAVAELAQVKETLRERYDVAEVIAIDEAQFFSDLLDFCTSAADEDSKRVIVAGLDGDFQREKFGQILDLVPKADSVTKLASWCTYCEAAGKRQDALFSLRIAADDRQEVVGGADKYAPVCRQHYISLSSLRHKQH